MTDNSEKSEKASWTGKAALAGAAIGSAALAAALLYASRRKERSDWREPKSEAFWRQLDRPVRPTQVT